MTNKNIEQAEKKLSEIGANSDTSLRRTAAIKLAEDLGVSIYDSHVPDVFLRTEVIVEDIYRFLQTKMMLNACVSAKQSCKWAAIAAIVASIGVIASLYVFLLKMIFQILRGI